MRPVVRAVVLVVLGLMGAPAASSLGLDLSAQSPKHNCSFCHNLHGGSYSALSDFAVVEDLCLSCHSDAGPAQVDRDGTLVDIPKQQNIHNGIKHTVPTSCRDCHIHEGEVADNIFMIPRTINVGGVDKTITFTNNATQADFIGTQGVCYACHTDAGTQANGLNGHNGPDVCTLCHTHDGGFQGAGGGCSGCHNSTRLADGHTHSARRQVVGTGGDYDRTSVHVTNVTDDDCVVCHDQRDGHSSDDLGVLLYDHDDGTSIEITHAGDPNSSSTEAAKLEQFCLGCHGDGSADKTGVTFPTGASATQPFASLATIPDVDPLVWAASSHEGGLTGGCYGNGAFGCHGNGHGSNLAKLRAPYGSSLNPTTLYEEEEGFCFSCHSGAGVSSLDIQAQFATPINWVDELAGLNSSTTLNDRHDVQHAAANVSGAKVECVNCHDPHTANASNRLRADPDPTDGTVPAAGARLTGSDYLTEWCLDCHDGSLPPGVTGPTTALVNMLTTHTTDSHGAGTANKVSLDTNIRPANQTPVTQISDWSQGDFLPCWACHKAHPDSLALLRALPGLRPDTIGAAYDAYEANNLFQMKNRVTKKDGVTLIPVDPANGGTTDPATSTGYEVTNNLSTQNFATDGYYFCNTCHYNHMNNTNCWRCHRHGQRF